MNNVHDIFDILDPERCTYNVKKSDSDQAINAQLRHDWRFMSCSSSMLWLRQSFCMNMFRNKDFPRNFNV